MTLSQRIEQDIISAMKSRDQERLDALRMLRSAIKYEEIALGHELTDDETLKVFSRQHKQRKDAAEQFRAGNRPEAADKEDREAALITEFLPTQLSDDELRELVRAAITETGATTPADMGKVIGAVVKKTGGAAEGARISAMVKELLV